MNWSSFKYLTKQGCKNMGANRLMTLAGVCVLTACLVLTGAAALFTLNVDSLVAYLGSQNETIVYLDPEWDGTEAEVQQLNEQILAVTGVSETTYYSKQDVLNEYRGYMEEYADLWDEFEADGENPFKANFSVVIEDLENIEAICDRLETVPHVVKVSAAVEMTDIFVKVQTVITYAGYVLVGVLALVSVVVISNTIRLSVYARRKEINIMKYVGATNGFIRWPFFVEGVLVGLLSSALASGIVLAGYAALVEASARLTGFWLTLISASIIPVQNVWYYILPAFLAAGAVMGGIGSVTSIRKHLNV